MGCSCGGKKSDDILLVKCGGGPWHSAGPFIWHACPYLEAPLQRGPGVCMPSRSHDQQVQHSLNLAQNSKNREGGMGAPHRWCKTVGLLQICCWASLLIYGAPGTNLLTNGPQCSRLSRGEKRCTHATSKQHIWRPAISSYADISHTGRNISSCKLYFSQVNMQNPHQRQCYGGIIMCKWPNKVQQKAVKSNVLRTTRIMACKRIWQQFYFP